MKSKRGQLTLFVIVAVVIVVAVVGVVFFVGEGFGKSGGDVGVVNDYVEDCILDVGYDAVVHVAERGGYYEVPVESVSFVPYYYDKGRDLMLSKEAMEVEVEKYVDNMLFFCTKNFEDFSDLNISQGEVSSSVDVRGDEVVFDVVYPISVGKGGNVYLLKDFSVVVPVALGKTRVAAREMVKSQMEYGDNICLSCFYEIAESNSLLIRLFDLSDDELLVRIVDYDSMIDEVPLTFNFVNRFDAVGLKDFGRERDGKIYDLQPVL